MAVAGTVTYVATTATFTPSILLSPNTVYTATITTGAKDLAGNALTGNYLWSFTTRASPVPVLTPVIFPVNTTANPSGTLNDASFTTPVAAGSIAAVFGSNLAIGQANWQVPTPLPTLLAQSSLSIGGRAAPLFFASPSQVNVQIPWELAGQTEATISATVGGVVSNIQKVNIAPFAPGIFTINATGSGQGAVLIAPTAQLAAPGTAVQRSAYISIFCTGLGAVSVQPANGAAAQGSALSYTLTLPTVTIGGVSALVTYSGLAPNWAGLYQVNAQVPASVSPGSTVSVVLSIGGATSNTVTIAVQ